MSQPGLFDVEPAPPVKPRKLHLTASWTSNATRVTCYACIGQLAAGEFITARRAQWKRTLGTDVELFCYEHATPLRDADHKEAARVAEPVSRRAGASADAWKTREEPTWLDNP